MSRRNRSTNQQYPVIHDDTTQGNSVIGRVGFLEGERKADAGIFDRMTDCNGAMVSYRLRAAKQSDDRSTISDPSPASIPASEMEIFAFTHFRDGQSRTKRMSEAQRLTRLFPNGRLRPAEDRVELVEEKVRLYNRLNLEPHRNPVGKKQRKALRAVERANR